MNYDFKYYLVVLLRRLHYVFFVFSAVLVLTVFIAFNIPPSYDASATLSVEAPQIPDATYSQVAGTTDYEQLQLVQQRLMTRTNLIEIAQKLNVFPSSATMTPDQIVTAMHKFTRINTVGGQSQATLMYITFSAGSAQTAAAVVDEYVDRILTDNTASRISQAQDTLQFFRQEVARLSDDLSEQSAKILEFQNQNDDALPNMLAFRLTQQANLQDRLSGMDRDIAGLKTQRQRLIDLYRSTGQLDGNTTAAQTPQAKELADLQLELTSALAIYSPSNPKVTLLLSKIASLQANVASQAADTSAAIANGVSGATAGPPSDSSSAPMSLLDIQVAQIDAQISQTQQLYIDVTMQLAALKDAIDRSAGVAVQLAALNRDYDNIQAQYNIATDRLSEASAAERIVAMSKGQRISILDAASVPDFPSGPSRLKLILLGAAMGLFLGVGLVGVLELLDTSVRSAFDLEKRLNITPIGIIPYVRTSREISLHRMKVALLVLLVLAGLPTGLYAVDTHFMPISEILEKIGSRLGI